IDRWPADTENAGSPHSNGSDFTFDGFFGPRIEASSTNPPATVPASAKNTRIPRYSAMVQFDYGGTVHAANASGNTPPIIVTNAASRSATETVEGIRPGAAPRGSVIYM